MTWTLACEGMPSPQVVHTVEDIEISVQQAIRHAKATHGYPTLVELSLDEESTMAIVVGAEQSYAAFIYTPNGPGFYAHRRHVPGRGERSDNPFVFVQFDSQSEADPDCTISFAEAWEALRLYFATGKRPETIDWRP